MDEGRVRMFREGYAALNRRDLDGAFKNLDPDFEATTTGAFLDEGVVYRGQEGAAEFLEMLGDAFERFHYEIEDMQEIDEQRVLVLIRLRARGKGSGVEVDTPVAHLWEFRGERAYRLRPFRDRDEALAELGLT